MSLFTPEFGLVFWMLVVFLILFGILAKYAWPAIVRMMDERADFIDKGVEYAREAKRDREKAQEDAKDLLTEARRQQLEVLQQTERLPRHHDRGSIFLHIIGCPIRHLRPLMHESPQHACLKFKTIKMQGRCHGP